VETESELKVAAGTDRFGVLRSLGISSIAFKSSSAEGGGLFALENVFHARGGPARHLHREQDEWFYCLEGEFRFEIGEAEFSLNPGDSVLGPRMVPHVWAHIGPATGRILVVFSPAGMMEAFFREVTKAGAMPPQDPELWSAHGMELLGPPMPIGGA
jgi:quercetin dioxygenase-like cupin family protein